MRPTEFGEVQRSEFWSFNQNFLHSIPSKRNPTSNFYHKPAPTLPQPTKIHLRKGSKPPIFTTKLLVHFQKQRITSANFQGFLDAVGIGDQQIISNDLLLLTGPLASRTIDDSRGSGEPNESNLFCQTLKWFQSNMLFTVISAEDVFSW